MASCSVRGNHRHQIRVLGHVVRENGVARRARHTRAATTSRSLPDVRSIAATAAVACNSLATYGAIVASVTTTVAASASSAFTVTTTAAAALATASAVAYTTASSTAATSAATASTLLRGSRSALRHSHQLSLVRAAATQRLDCAVSSGAVPGARRARARRHGGTPDGGEDVATRGRGRRLSRRLQLQAAFAQSGRVPRAVAAAVRQPDRELRANRTGA